MKAATLPLESLKRITVIDALRGFALFGIILVHMVEQYYANEPPAGKLMNGAHSLIDNIVQGLISTFVMAKFFTIFSFLFGLSFFIQMDRAHRKSLDFKGRFCWRLLILFAIGYIHGLFYAGDILIIYALMGFVLIFFYAARDKVIIVAIIILMSGLPRLLVVGYQQAFIAPETEVQKKEHQEDILKYYNALKTGSMVDVFKINSFKSIQSKMDYQFGVMGRGYQTLALFLLGLLVGRKHFFENMDEYKIKTKKALKKFGIIAGSILLIFIAFFVIGNLLGYSKQSNNPSPWFIVIGLTLYDTFNLAVTGIYVTAFVLLYQKGKTHRVLSKLAPYGRMGLTSYVSQTLIGVTIFYGFSLGLLDTMGTAVCALLGIGIFFLQTIISKWWLSYFNYGPLEWFWRTATYLKSQPFRKKELVSVHE